MLISEGYREQQQALHQNPAYGVASTAYAPLVKELIDGNGVTDLLDYGAGKGRLGEALFLAGYTGSYRPYDPAIPYWSDDPEPAEMVACIDVLEHIEPDLLDDVLDDLRRVTQRLAVLTVHTGPAKKTLPDGRNAHLTQQPAEWWEARLAERFAIRQRSAEGKGAVFVVEPRP